MMGSRKQFFSTNNTSKDIPEFNIVLLGALGVGKSALTVKYITKRFIMEYDPALEDVYSKQDALDGQEVCVKIMDTYDKEDADCERYLRWAVGFVVAYSITAVSSFDTARSILELLSQDQRLLASRDRPIALVGNKVDLERYRTVSKAAGQELANEYECSFFECSAADDLESVEAIFHDVIAEISRVNERQVALQPLFISEDATRGLQGSGINQRPTPLRRNKSPKSPDIKDKDRKDDNRDARIMPRRTVPTFKIFNKGFKIFN